MDRQIVYPGQILPETTLLQIAKDSMIGLAKLSAAVLGTGTMVNGFAVTPTGPASLQVVVAPGELYSLTAVDGTAWSSLAADTTHTIVKQGIALDSTTLTCAAPTTNGQSISYLIQASYLDLDSTPVLLPYYNSANPSQPYSGLGNNGLTQNTVRKGTVVLQAKAGASAATGSQVIPAPDAGYVGLYVVTVAYGQTATTAANIARYSATPIVNSTLLGLSPAFSVSPTVPMAALAAQVPQFGQIAGVVGAARNVSMSVAAASATATLKADEVVVSTALGGLRYSIASFNKTINLAATGAGGMDTGTVPASGFVALYAIYNPTTGASALLAVNATSAKAPEVYGGANMPAGYTASALVSVWPTSSSGLLIEGLLLGRHVSIPSIIALSTTTQVATITALSIAGAVPKNANAIDGFVAAGSTLAATIVMSIWSSSTRQIGQFSAQWSGGTTTQNSAFAGIQLVAPQTIGYLQTVSVGSPSFQISLTGYSF